MYQVGNASYNSDYLRMSSFMFNEASTIDRLEHGEISSGSTIYYYNIFEVSVGNDLINSEKSIELNDLIDYKYQLTKPLIVEIKRDETDFIGEIKELDIYAFGDTEFEVLREINRDVTELFEEIFNLNENQLGSKPLKWKTFLSEYVKRDSD